MDRPPLEIRARLVQLDNRFSINSHNKLVFKAVSQRFDSQKTLLTLIESNNVSTEVELLRGGPGVALALPSVTSTPKVVVDSGKS